MPPRLLFTAVGLAFVAHTVIAQESKPLPDKLAGLKFNYETAIVRATAPITQTYVQELRKLKTEYTKAGNLEAALAADSILKEATAKTQVPQLPAAAARRLSQMTIGEFKEWLTTVIISESKGEKTVFQYDGTTITSIRGPSPVPRIHKKVEVDLGKISVPFSTDLAVIRIGDNLKTAVITYDDEPPIDARITPKPKG